MVKLFPFSVLLAGMIPAVAMAQGPSVVVETPEALTRAYAELSQTPGGGVIELDANFPPTAEIALRDGGAEPVHVTSANRVRVSRIAVVEAQNIRISGLDVNSVGVSRSQWLRDLDVNNASRIEISDVVFSSDADSFFQPSDPNGSNGGEMALIRNSQDITITGNHVSGYLHGLQVFESTDITVQGNEITEIIGDGIRLAGVQNVDVSGNHLHDFFATTNEYTHSDFIQLWSTNAQIESRDVTISGNLLDAGNGNSAQGIWMRNELNDTGADRSYVYENLVITDNVIYTGSPNGIGIGVADGVTVSNNTLLWNPEATTLINGREYSWPPSIRIDDRVQNAELHDNIAYEVANWRLDGPPEGDANLSGNILLSYNAGHPNYIGNHFPDLVGGGHVDLTALQLTPGSPWVGTGAPLAQP
jgi:parallel beta-helix repeat protein